MRIAYIWARPIPSRETDTQQVLKTVDALLAEGVEIELIIPRTFFMMRYGMESFEQKVHDFYGLKRKPKFKTIMGVEPSRLDLERPVHSLLACIRLPFVDYDVVYTRSRSTTVLCAIIGQKVVFETYRTLGTDNPLLVRLLKQCSKKKNFLGIITHSYTASRSIEKAGFPKLKLATIHNGFDPDDMEPRLDKTAARSKLGLKKDHALVVYTGHLRADKGIPALIDAAALTPEIQFLLVGGNPQDIDVLEAELRSRSLSNVRCLGWRPAASLPDFMYAADALIVPPSARPLREFGRTVLPMKIFAYLAAGRPIVAAATDDLQEILVDGVNAFLVPPDKPDTTAAALRKILDDPLLADRIAAGALKTSQEFTWRSRARRVTEQINRWMSA